MSFSGLWLPKCRVEAAVQNSCLLACCRAVVESTPGSKEGKCVQRCSNFKCFADGERAQRENRGDLSQNWKCNKIKGKEVGRRWEASKGNPLLCSQHISTMDELDVAQLKPSAAVVFQWEKEKKALMMMGLGFGDESYVIATLMSCEGAFACDVNAFDVVRLENNAFLLFFFLRGCQPRGSDFAVGRRSSHRSVASTGPFKPGACGACCASTAAIAAARACARRCAHQGDDLAKANRGGDTGSLRVVRPLPRRDRGHGVQGN